MHYEEKLAINRLINIVEKLIEELRSSDSLYTDTTLNNLHNDIKKLRVDIKKDRLADDT